MQCTTMATLCKIFLPAIVDPSVFQNSESQKESKCDRYANTISCAFCRGLENRSINSINKNGYKYLYIEIITWTRLYVCFDI